jgi:hypothetical protein
VEEGWDEGVEGRGWGLMRSLPAVEMTKAGEGRDDGIGGRGWVDWRGWWLSEISPCGRYDKGGDGRDDGIGILIAIWNTIQPHSSGSQPTLGKRLLHEAHVAASVISCKLRQILRLY